MKTTRQQQDATRRQIVASAVDLMTRQGFDGTTMKDIARAAGIGDATIYKYFPTKDRIVLGYLDDVIMPRETRKRIVRALKGLRTKQLSNPWKKHDNIPL